MGFAALYPSYEEGCCYCFTVTLRRPQRGRLEGSTAPSVADSSFEARPAAQLRRKARTSSDKGEAFARG
ncbi:hypothetical protein J2R80_000994 [Bradyrhizobium sp. USDA 4541]|nr:hypothetical protein [Bradyrhizobium sp. USDA 4541]